MTVEDSQPLISKTIVVTPQETLAVNQFLLRSLIVRQTLLFAAVAAVPLIVWTFSHKSLDLAFGIGFMVNSALMPLYYRWWILRWMNKPANARWKVPCRAEAYEDELRLFADDGVESKVPWGAFLGYKMWGQNILLMLGERLSVIMFERAFEPKDWKEFRELVSKKVKPA